MSGESAPQVDVQKMLAFRTEECVDTFNSRDAIIYSLSLGYSSDPMNESDLKYTFELNDEFKAFPTFACVLPKIDIFKALTSCPGLPNFNPMMLLHGEQRLETYRPLVPDTKYVTQARIADVADKVKGMLLSFELLSYEVDENNKKHLAFKNIMNVFIRKLGGFGFKGNNSTPVLPKKPTRQPDATHLEKTTPNQAILYRLNGDYNPLHIDPSMAAMGGFDKPILHGMCFYGLMTKAVVVKFLDNDSSRVSTAQARFTSHVFPGETIEFQLWKDGDKVFVSGATVERKLECIVGVVELKPAAKL
ncbi:MaoC-like domain protein (macronuclear) [Tetrahymena thermophila SB210]|uniref:MaoC-like domain protein n=1 Tax=Tetrahymena thermophila (strain SB210) TaxID=312017 RepID=I7M2J5_TETTS|nr:MaoC-like domain protein [Tetrahymena thermophila SB210]EAS00575.1 MaoC-like domain protein [Tetrahymena thermophila SB210]|eukprot:XP_001020820.1 MaoC-like domain protein [Tetrahymena thermophila SB210]